MSQVVSYSRGDLYEKYKKSDLQLAEKFFEDKNCGLLEGGIILSILGIGAAVGSLIIFGAVGILPDPVVFGIVGGICGPLAVPGLIMLGIWYSKRRIMLAEQLPAEKINAIAGKILVDPTKGFSSL